MICDLSFLRIFLQAFRDAYFQDSIMIYAYSALNMTNDGVSLADTEEFDHRIKTMRYKGTYSCRLHKKRCYLLLDIYDDYYC